MSPQSWSNRIPIVSKRLFSSVPVSVSFSGRELSVRRSFFSSSVAWKINSSSSGSGKCISTDPYWNTQSDIQFIYSSESHVPRDWSRRASCHLVQDRSSDISLVSVGRRRTALHHRRTLLGLFLFDIRTRFFLVLGNLSSHSRWSRHIHMSHCQSTREREYVHSFACATSDASHSERRASRTWQSHPTELYDSSQQRWKEQKQFACVNHVALFLESIQSNQVSRYPDQKEFHG